MAFGFEEATVAALPWEWLVANLTKWIHDHLLSPRRVSDTRFFQHEVVGIFYIVVRVRKMNEELEDANEANGATTVQGIFLPVGSSLGSMLGGCCLARNGRPDHIRITANAIH